MYVFFCKIYLQWIYKTLFFLSHIVSTILASDLPVLCFHGKSHIGLGMSLCLMLFYNGHLIYISQYVAKVFDLYVRL